MPHSVTWYQSVVSDRKSEELSTKSGMELVHQCFLYLLTLSKHFILVRVDPGLTPDMAYGVGTHGFITLFIHSFIHLFAKV